MLKAFKAVKSNRGAAGIDKVSVQMFDANREENLTALMRDLKRGTFQPRPLRRVYIAKSGKPTKLRPLGIPVVRDRVAQEVLRQLLSPIFERRFHDNSFGFRPGRSCHQAIQRILELEKLNQVIRGTAMYFVTDFSNCRWQFQKLDSWVRMRLRCMKLKRKWRNDNYKLRIVYFRKNLGLLSLEDFCLNMRKDTA